MKIPKYDFYPSAPQMSFEAFIQHHNLILEVHERPRNINVDRYYASCKDVEIKEGSFLSSNSGNGNTKEDAIINYATQLVGKLLIYRAYGKDRKEIRCPNEWLND